MKKRILVTGGTGYIGSHTVVELQNAGYEVVIIDNLSNSNIDVIDGIENITHIRPDFVEADCTDMAALRKLFDTYPDICGIINFAASKAVGESVHKPLLYYRNNLNTLTNLLELMPEYNVKGIVFSSSCTVYGEPDKNPVDENAPIKKATSPYGNTKQISEEIITDAINSGVGYKSIILRYFNPVGAHPSAEIGELPNGVPQNLIPYLTQTAIGIRKELSVFGDDYDTPDGSCIRDFINVVDLAKPMSLQSAECLTIPTPTRLKYSILAQVQAFPYLSSSTHLRLRPEWLCLTRLLDVEKATLKRFGQIRTKPTQCLAGKLKLHLPTL